MWNSITVWPAASRAAFVSSNARLTGGKGLTIPSSRRRPNLSQSDTAFLWVFIAAKHLTEAQLLGQLDLAPRHVKTV